MIPSISMKKYHLKHTISYCYSGYITVGILKIALYGSEWRFLI